MEFKEGDKVSYAPEYGEVELGMVKRQDDDFVFVVYHCNDDWDNFRNYTAARTPIGDLHKGWHPLFDGGSDLDFYLNL